MGGDDGRRPRPRPSPDPPPAPARPPEARDSRAGFVDLVRSCDTRAVRRWAREQGIEVAPTGGLPRFVYEAYLARRP